MPPRQPSGGDMPSLPEYAPPTVASTNEDFAAHPDPSCIEGATGGLSASVAARSAKHCWTSQQWHPMHSLLPLFAGKRTGEHAGVEVLRDGAIGGIQIQRRQDNRIQRRRNQRNQQ